jgi:hypothetical protein
LFPPDDWRGFPRVMLAIPHFEQKKNISKANRTVHRLQEKKAVQSGAIGTGISFKSPFGSIFDSMLFLVSS